jgi:protein-S-isoprenylcysteine O-methyltransferase Ste14
MKPIQALELKVPPPVVAGMLAAAMWGLSRITPSPQIPGNLRVLGAIALAVLGIAFASAAVLSFRRAQTTVDPLEPQRASALVTSGVYRITRNPMYVGMALVLVAWAVFLSSAWALLGLPAFVLYLGRLQIAPEERALATLFGAQYSHYASTVRRWL